MKTLIPAVHFLELGKDSDGFIHRDKRVKSTPTLVYINLFKEGFSTGICRLPQKELAAYSKCSVRALQGHLRLLASLGYIQILSQSDGTRAYRLILNELARIYLSQNSGTTSRNGHTQNLRVEGEKSAHDLAQNLRVEGEKSARPPFKRVKELKKLTPLSPLPPNSGDRPLPESGGRGGSNSSGKNKKAFLAANAAFEQFLAAYPRKEAREAARSIWHQLWRSGELPALAKLLAVLEQFRASASWTKEHGRFVPYAVNWLRAKRWLDFAESEPQSAPASSAPARPVTLPEPRPDPSLEGARPLFERFFARFQSNLKRGPAWGLWSTLFRQGHAPSADDVKNGMGDAFAFLQDWQRGTYATA